MNDDDMELIADFEEEQIRIGHFEKLFPKENNIN